MSKCVAVEERVRGHGMACSISTHNKRRGREGSAERPGGPLAAKFIARGALLPEESNAPCCPMTITAPLSLRGGTGQAKVVATGERIGRSAGGCCLPIELSGWEDSRRAWNRSREDSSPLLPLMALSQLFRPLLR